jgi:hypothetical protein
MSQSGSRQDGARTLRFESLMAAARRVRTALGCVLAFAAAGLSSTGAATAPDLLVAGHALPLGSLLGSDVPSVAAACPPPPTSLDVDGLITAACAKVAAGGELWTAYGDLASAYLNRGLRHPPSSLTDAWLGAAGLVAMLRHAPSDRVFQSPALEAMLRGAGAIFTATAVTTGEPKLYELSADAYFTAAATCLAGPGPVCAATDRLRATGSLVQLGQWQSNPAALRRAMQEAHAASDALPRTGNEKLWLLLRSKAAEANLVLSNLTEQPDEHLSLVEAAVAEMADSIPDADRLPHDADWSSIQQSIAQPVGELAILQHDLSMGREALTRYENALTIYRADVETVPWLNGQINVGLWHEKLARLDDFSADWTLAALTLENALDTVAQTGASLPLHVAHAGLVHAIALVGLGRTTWAFGGRAQMQAARDEFNSIEPVFAAAGTQLYVDHIRAWQTYLNSALATR